MGDQKLILVVFALILHCGIVQSQTGTNETIVDVLEGKDFSRVCNQSQYPDNKVFWTKNSTSESFIVHGADLNFTDIHRQQTGEYLCQAHDDISNTNVTLDDIYVNVLYQSRILSMTISTEQILENSTFTFNVVLEGNPTPAWFLMNNYTHDFIDVGQSAGNITMGPFVANCSSTGIYVLQAFNEAESLIPSVRSCNLTVLCSPRPAEGVNQYVVSGFLGMEAYLIMNSLSRPYPNFTWSRADGQPLPEYVVTKSVQSVAVLDVKINNISDYTDYNLVMTNYLGSYTANYKLQARGNPQTPTNLQVTNITYDSAIIHWTSGYDMGSQQHFTILQWFDDVGNYIQISNDVQDTSSNHGVGQNWSYLQHNLVSDSDIELVVVSTNALGLHSGYQNPPLTFHTLARPVKDDQESTNVGLIAGISVGTVVLVALAAGALFFFLRTTRRSTYGKY